MSFFAGRKNSILGKLGLLFLLLTTDLLSQSPWKTRVFQEIEKALEQKGRVDFSRLYNSDQFTRQEKALLGRLYEVFFQIPGHLGAEYEGRSEIPTREEIATHFDLSVGSVDLLLTVLTSDVRLPRLLTRNATSREIETLNMGNIEAFTQIHGGRVQVLQWTGKRLPSFELETLEGSKIRSADLAGRNVLIYFWFTGCPPCVRIAPILAELDRRYEPSNFRVIGFNADRILGLTTSDEERKNHLEKLGVTFTNTHLDGITNDAFGNVKVFPTLFLVKDEGTIFRHWINYQDRETLEAAIKDLIRSRGE